MRMIHDVHDVREASARSLVSRVTASRIGSLYHSSRQRSRPPVFEFFAHVTKG
jgi:hypothetical protein